MANQTFHLVILTPNGRYLEQEVTFLSVRSSKYSLGILPNHAPLISTLDICPLVIRDDEGESTYAISGGIIHVEKNIVTLILNAIEHVKDINVPRAQASKSRAEERLKNANADSTIDVERAKASLARANNRLALKQ